MKSSKLLDVYPLVALVLVALVMVGLFGLTGCGPVPDAAAETVAPEMVVEEFYGWYLDAIGDRASGEFRNPLVDGSYRSSELLSPVFVESVDELLDSIERGGYDPFLCAQDIPQEVFVGEATVSGEAASVEVETSFTGHRFEVQLERADGVWQIADVVCTP